MECEEREEEEDSNALIREYTNCILQMEKDEDELIDDRDNVDIKKVPEDKNTLKIEDKTEEIPDFKEAVPPLKTPKGKIKDAVPVVNPVSIDPAKNDPRDEGLNHGNKTNGNQVQESVDSLRQHTKTSVSSLTPTEVVITDPLEEDIVPLKHWETRNGNNNTENNDQQRCRRKSRKSAIVQPNIPMLVKEKSGDYSVHENDSEPARVDANTHNSCDSLNGSRNRLIQEAIEIEPPVSIRKFNERAPQENFILYGLLTPALCLVPGIDGHDALTKSFTELHGENRELKLAAAHIDDALSGRGKYGKARSYFKNKFGRWCFMMIESKWFNRLVLFMTVVHLILTFLEPPGDNTYIVAVYVLTPVCLLVYALDVFVRIKFLSWRIFWTLDENKWTRVEFIFVCFYTIDFIMLILDAVFSARLVQPFRCLRAAIILCKSRNVGHIYDVVTSIVLKLGKVFFIIFTFIMLFSAVGVHLFMEDYQSIPDNFNCTDIYTTTETSIYYGSFNNVAIAFLRMFVLLSTENYPEIMIPAYVRNHFSFFYFGIYLFVGVFFLTAILLAIIVDSYWEFAKKDVKKERSRERAELAKAWNLLDPLGSGHLKLDDSRFLKLFQMLRPKNTEQMNLQLIHYLDSNGDEEIDSFEWTIRLSEALSFEFEETKVDSIDKFPKWLQAICRVARKIDRSAIFSKFILVLIFIHCLLFCIYSSGITIQIMKSIIVSIFFIELALRIVGENTNLLEPVELLDVVLIIVAIVTNFVWYVDDVDEGNTALHAWSTVSSGLAVFFRLGFNLYQTKKLIILFKNRIFPVMFDLIVLVFIIIYFYAIIGFEAFSDWARDPTYTSSHYDYCCGLGFDTFPCALLVIFQIVTTSNWHEIMNSVMESVSDVTCLYFVSCYIVINLVVMNLFVAIAIEAFNKLGTEKELEAAEKESIENEAQELEDKGKLNTAKTFLNNIFESSRVEEEKERSIRPTNSPRMRRPSRVSIVHQNPGMSPFMMSPMLNPPLSPPTVVEEEEEPNNSDEEDASDLKHMTPKEKREHMIKKKKMRKKKKKNNPKTKILVVTAYRGTKDQELDLNVADEVQVLQKQDDWWEGKIQERVGWFPASHVREVKRKAVELPNPDVKLEERRTSSPPVPAWSEDVPRRNSNLASTLPLTAPSNNGVQRSPNPPVHRSSVPPQGRVGPREVVSAMNVAIPKLKMKNKGDWRREILGDITVMNPEEMKALSKILRSGSLGGSLPNKKRNSLISDIVEEDEEPPAPKQTTSPFTLPVFNFEIAPTMDFLEEVENESESAEKTDDDLKDADTLINQIDTLTVETPELPSDIKKKKQKEKTKAGEMPAWMQNFVASKQINIGADFDETDLDKETTRSEKDQGSLVSIPGTVLVDEDAAVADYQD